MDTLDTLTPPAKMPIWDTALRYGGYCGGLMVVLSVLTYLMDMNMMSIGTMLMVYGAVFIIGFAMAAIAMKYQRDQLDGGFISYGKALAVGVLVVMIGVFMSSVWNYILINFIDPDMIGKLKEQFMDSWGANMPEDALEETLKKFEEGGSILTIFKNGIIGGGIFGLIIGLITAAFIKREPKPDYMR